jgi:hypothetical protein
MIKRGWKVQKIDGTDGLLVTPGYGWMDDLTSTREQRGGQRGNRTRRKEVPRVPSLPTCRGRRSRKGEKPAEDTSFVAACHQKLYERGCWEKYRGPAARLFWQGRTGCPFCSATGSCPASQFGLVALPFPPFPPAAGRRWMTVLSLAARPVSMLRSFAAARLYFQTPPSVRRCPLGVATAA